jgi:hypothetical protein
MRTIFATTILVLGGGAFGGCATGQDMSLYEGEPHPAEVVIANCDAATATLKERDDYPVAHRACVRAKTRQKVD